MENLHLNSRYDLQRYVEKHAVKRLGIGREGTCSLLDNGSVIKCFYEDYYPDFVLQYKDLDIPSFVFAKAGAFIGDFVAASLMDYADGKSVRDKKPDDQRIDVLGDQLDILAKDVITLSDMGILIKDFHIGNIIYNGNRFRIIDTLPYLKLGSNYKTENLREVMNQMYEGILSDVMENKELRRNHSFWGRLDTLENPKEYFNEVKTYIEDIIGEEVTTLKDASKVLKKI